MAQTTFRAEMDSRQTVAPSNSSATGTCIAVLNDAETEIEISCNHNVGAPIGAHVHNAPPGVGGSVVFELGNGENPIAKTWSNPPADMIEELFDGNLYINVHSQEYPQGAIRGQLLQSEASASEPSVLYFVQMGNGGGLRSEIVLMNLSDSETVTGKLEFFTPRGDPMELGIEGAGQAEQVDFVIDPLDSVTIATDGLGTEPLGGSAVASSAQPLGGVIRFELEGVGIAGVGSSPPVSSALVPVRRVAGGVSTGIAIRNTSDEVIRVIAGLRMNGELIEEKAVDLRIDGRDARFIDEIFDTEFGEEFVGTVQLDCEGDCRFAAVALELDVPGGKFTTLPVASRDSGSK